MLTRFLAGKVFQKNITQLIGLFFPACSLLFSPVCLPAQNSNNDSAHFVVKGTAEGIDSGIVVLNGINYKERNVFNFPGRIVAGKFEITGSVNEPTMMTFNMNGLGNGAPFYLENSVITIRAYKNEPDKIEVEGSRSEGLFI